MVTPLRSPSQPAATFDPRKEFVAAGGYFSTRLGAVLNALFAADAELVAGADVYEKMLTDGKVSSCRNILRDSVLADDVQIHPAVSGEKNPDFELAKEIADFCSFSLGCLRRPLRAILRDALGDALAFGHKVAEITYKDWTDEQGRPRLVHDQIKLKPRSAAQFVVDEFTNVTGLQVWSPTSGVRQFKSKRLGREVWGYDARIRSKESSHSIPFINEHPPNGRDRPQSVCILTLPSKPHTP